MDLLKCREWQELRVGDKGLTEPEANRFHALAERAGRRLKLGETGVLVRTRRGLKAQQVVGVLAVPGRTLEILPKIDGENDAVRKALVHMLAVAHDLRVADDALTGMARQTHDLLELLIRLFAARLLAAVRRGLPRRYIACEEDLRLLRGRLDVVRQFTRHAVRPDRLACRFDELSEDTPLNRVLKAAVLRLARMTRSAANARLLAELAARFEFTGDSVRPLEEPVRLDRTNTAFHDLYRLARLFLKGEWQDTAAGRPAGFALLFPMNDLFEAFIGRSLQRALSPRRVRLQARGEHALKDEKDDKLLFALRPDAVIEPPGGRIVLDTKWKALDPARDDFGIAPGDIYQMLVYGRAYGAARAILLYPWQGDIGLAEGVVRRWTAAGADSLRLDIATINVGCPKDVRSILRKIVNEVSDGAETRATGQRDESVPAPA
ncbi:MAG: restriction endonuclease [Rhodospirillaceae bacterium]|nr:restriction endonuclease [Rhodospirillaceae bacterium]MYB15242.1 restriction endonuclease [Rhodospirillaceae bacterium]MYI50747.1 restriction endonuclease [Rhodospirillaceae bacterium]